MYTVSQTEEFVAWLDDLKDKRAQVRIAARLRQAESGSLGDLQAVEKARHPPSAEARN